MNERIFKIPPKGLVSLDDDLVGDNAVDIENVRINPAGYLEKREGYAEVGSLPTPETYSLDIDISTIAPFRNGFYALNTSKTKIIKIVNGIYRNEYNFPFNTSGYTLSSNFAVKYESPTVYIRYFTENTTTETNFNIGSITVNDISIYPMDYRSAMIVIRYNSTYYFSIIATYFNGQIKYYSQVPSTQSNFDWHGICSRSNISRITSGGFVRYILDNGEYVFGVYHSNISNQLGFVLGKNQLGNRTILREVIASSFPAKKILGFYINSLSYNSSYGLSFDLDLVYAIDEGGVTKIKCENITYSENTLARTPYTDTSTLQGSYSINNSVDAEAPTYVYIEGEGRYLSASIPFFNHISIHRVITDNIGTRYFVGIGKIDRYIYGGFTEDMFIDYKWYSPYYGQERILKVINTNTYVTSLKTVYGNQNIYYPTASQNVSYFKEGAYELILFEDRPPLRFVDDKWLPLYSTNSLTNLNPQTLADTNYASINGGVFHIIPVYKIGNVEFYGQATSISGNYNKIEFNAHPIEGLQAHIGFRVIFRFNSGYDVLLSGVYYEAIFNPDFLINATTTFTLHFKKSVIELTCSSYIQSNPISRISSVDFNGRHRPIDIKYSNKVGLWQNRLVFADKNKIYFTDLNGLTDENYLYIDVGGNEEIVALQSIRDSLLIFKQNEIWILAGEYPTIASIPNIRLDLLIKENFSIFPNSIVYTDGNVYFASDKGVYKTNGFSFERIDYFYKAYPFSDAIDVYGAILEDKYGKIYILHPKIASNYGTTLYFYNLNGWWEKHNFNRTFISINKYGNRLYLIGTKIYEYPNGTTNGGTAFSTKVRYVITGRNLKALYFIPRFDGTCNVRLDGISSLLYSNLLKSGRKILSPMVGDKIYIEITGFNRLYDIAVGFRETMANNWYYEGNGGSSP